MQLFVNNFYKILILNGGTTGYKIVTVAVREFPIIFHLPNFIISRNIVSALLIIFFKKGYMDGKSIQKNPGCWIEEPDNFPTPSCLDSVMEDA